MDDTQASLKDAAAATRKRRSSILKSHRPPRTPFSELEFNLATPTDTAKSRRVSFSRRTGVAEFVTNEATTTWKNFYEEHNKSLESSGNESNARHSVNAPRMVVGHIGKRIFDQQFEEVEVVDIGGTLQSNTALQDFQASFNNINLTQQLAAFDCTGDDKKLCPPQQNFELSALPDHHSKVFGDDLSIPITTEMSNPININFSNINPLGSSKFDDLEEIERDLERSKPHNVVCPGPFSGGRDLSEYIEIDLNMTNVGIKTDDCDMSITDTIHSPKVQEVVKPNTSVCNKKANVNDDWLVDKENIAINPYVTPKESLNFAVNKESNEVLVFDGKKLIVQSESQITLKSENNHNPTQPLISADATPKRKTITLNMNDDLPNFIQNTSSVIVNQISNIGEERKSVIYNDFDLSITQAVGNKIELPKRKTIVFEDDMGNISMTQAVPTNVIINKQVKRQTILYENDMNLSITQAVPVNIIEASKNPAEKRKTIVYADGDISFTQAIPANLVLNASKQPSQDKTIHFQENFDMSVTQAIPENIIKSNISKVHDLPNLSMTQAIPTNLIISKEVQDEKTVIYKDQEDIDIEITQAVSDNILFNNKMSNEKRKTIVYDNDGGDISITQVIPSNILIEKNTDYINQTNLKLGFQELSPTIDTDDINSKTVLCDAQDDIFTKDMPSNISQTDKLNKTKMLLDKDVSITRPLPTNILQEETQINHLSESGQEPNIRLSSNLNTGNKSMVKTIGNISKLLEESKIFDNNLSNLSITKPIPTEILAIDNEFSKKCEIDGNKSIFHQNSSVNQDILIYQTTEHSVEKLNKIDKPEFKDNKLNVSSKNLKESNDKSLSPAQGIVKQDLNKAPERKSIKMELKKSKNENDYKNNDLHKTSTTKSVTDKQHSKPKKSILSELLDMSCVSSDDEKECLAVDNCEIGSNEKEAIASDLIQKTGRDVSNVGCIEVENKLNVTTVKDNFAANEGEEEIINSATKLNKEELIENVKQTAEGESSESLFLITRDSEEEMKTEHFGEKTLLISKPTKALFEPQDNDISINQKPDLNNEVGELKSANKDARKSINRYYEKIISADMQKTTDSDQSQVKNELHETFDFDKSDVKNANSSRNKKSFHNADDTNELLEMLSDFTDGQVDKQESNKSADDININRTTVENKKARLSMINEPLRLSMIPKRQSIAISREDLMTNISMAHAALQQSRFEIDDSGSIEDTQDSPEDDVSEMKESPKKSVRMSMEVVKTLQFEEDDSVCDISMNESRMSPLKKTAFGETSYMKEDKAKVIPSYDVSDEIKELMHDLVKPMADVIHCNTQLKNSVKESLSTCSTQIQANLITSSQIDIDVELRSTAESVDYVETNKDLALEVAAAGNMAVTHALRQSLKTVSPNDSLEIKQMPCETQELISTGRKSIPGPIITFDQTNPLNNILLTQVDYTNVHKYEPISPLKNKSIEQNNTVTEIQNKEKQSELETTTMQCNITRKSQFQTELECGDTCLDVKESHSVISNMSKPVSIDRSTDGLITEVKSIEVNTLIVMKPNKDLLECHSSLTLVDDALAKSNFDVKIESSASDIETKKSPLKVIYKMDTDEDIHKMDSDFTSNDEYVEDVTANTRKRSYSPTKQDRNRLSQPNVEVTPKPISKMQKLSNSPQVIKNKQNSVKTELKSDLDKSLKKKASPEKKNSPKKKISPKRENVVTVQQLITECYIDSSRDKKIDRHILEALKDVPSETLLTETLSVEGVKSTDTVVSVNSKSVKEQDVSSAESTVGSNVSRVNWQTGVVDELSSKNLIEECSSSANVVAKINTLPFMGRECEWESSNSDVWSFLLLRSRLRVTARLAHTHHNASRSRVRADTALVGLTVDPVRNEEQDPLAALTIRLAGESMRSECARCSTAGYVPTLLRRCAGVARVALRWARVMRDARLRLAYTVTPDGELTLKVANIPLRSVWEVRMRIEMVLEDARGGAWPGAGRVRVLPVLCAETGAPPCVDRLVERLPRDWGQVPAAVWKVFRYLKNKTKQENLLGL